MEISNVTTHNFWIAILTHLDCQLSSLKVRQRQFREKGNGLCYYFVQQLKQVICYHVGTQCRVLYLYYIGTKRSITHENCKKESFLYQGQGYRVTICTHYICSIFRYIYIYLYNVRSARCSHHTMYQVFGSKK